ncbi:MAG: AAA family ATPase [Opitutales bacterium]|jgi:predicted ABC-type ATPase
MTNDPTIYVLAGVNGSGKSSIGGANFASRGREFYDPDDAARKMRELHPNMTQKIANGHAWTIGKEMLENAVDQKKTFAFETTLGGRTITQLLLQAAKAGLKVKIWYVGLKSVELNLARVKARTARGGHDIPEEAIRRRWDDSRRNLIHLLPNLSALRLFDNSEEADPHEGKRPEPRLLLEVEEGKITGSGDLSQAPEWARPIIAAALQVCTRD